MDLMVLKVQNWLNETYGKYEASGRFNRVLANGKTGWKTIYGLRRALQIELGIENTSDSFGPTTYNLCPNINQGATGNLVYIVQGGLYCKGYNLNGFDGVYGNGAYSAVKSLKADMGFPNASGNMNRDIMKALLDMSAFTLLPGGTSEIREIQQKLNYDYYDYYQISPCNGLYDREMNKMLIYGLQKEMGIPKSSATGSWGPTTISKCPTLNLGDSNNFVKLVRYATVCNGYSVNVNTSIYDKELESKLIKFSQDLLIPKINNVIDYPVIKSLLSSNGDTSRSAKGCDTATRLDQDKINTLKNEGYEIVGRYLTNVEGGTLDKKMTLDEIQLIIDNGLSIFPIFQEYGASNSAFNYAKGVEQAEKAIKAAKGLKIPHGTTIYFAVDYDPQQSEIENYVIDYFKGITDIFTREEFVYEIGVYGSRNVCLNLDRSSMVSIKNKFVSSSSYGFSGNLGYVMPKDWAFDQFAVDLVIGSGAGKLSIDKVAVSGLDNGFNKLIDIDIEKEMIEFGTNKGLFKGLGLEIEQLNQRTGAALLSFIPKITLACELSMTSKVVGPGVETINLSMAGTDITSSILGKFNAVGVQFDKSQNFASLMNRLILVQNITPNLRYKVQFSPLGVEVTFEASSSVENSDGVVRTLYYRLIFNIDKVAWETAMIANKIQVPVEAGPTDIYEVEKEFIITDAFAAVAVVAMSAFIIKTGGLAAPLAAPYFMKFI